MSSGSVVVYYGTCLCPVPHIPRRSLAVRIGTIPVPCARWVSLWPVCAGPAPRTSHHSKTHGSLGSLGSRTFYMTGSMSHAHALPAPQVRLHLLSPLLDEAHAHLHATLCASVLGRKLLRLPFHRDVQLTPKGAQRLLDCLRRCRKVGWVCALALRQGWHIVSVLVHRLRTTRAYGPARLVC